MVLVVSPSAVSCGFFRTEEDFFSSLLFVVKHSSVVDHTEKKAKRCGEQRSKISMKNSKRQKR
jgi:hypothetical protein